MKIHYTAICCADEVNSGYEFDYQDGDTYYVIVRIEDGEQEIYHDTDDIDDALQRYGELTEAIPDAEFIIQRVTNLVIL